MSVAKLVVADLREGCEVLVLVDTRKDGDTFRGAVLFLLECSEYVSNQYQVQTENGRLTICASTSFNQEWRGYAFKKIYICWGAYEGKVQNEIRRTLVDPARANGAWTMSAPLF